MSIVLQLPKDRPSDPFESLWESFTLALQARNNSGRTVEIYSEGARQLHEYLLDHQRPVDPGRITRGDVEAWLASLLKDGKSPATVRARFSALRTFFNWLVREGEITDSPMRTMQSPTVPDIDVPVLSDDQLRALLKACEGNDIESRRDHAIVDLMIDTGLRRTEVAKLKVEDVDLRNRILMVTGKGGHREVVPFGVKVAADIDRYRRARGQHPNASSEYLWLGRSGPLSSDGLHQMLQRRAAMAGIEHMHAHLLRHAFADAWQRAGGSETDLMKIGRWRDSKIMRKYAQRAATERAIAAHRRLSPADNL